MKREHALRCGVTLAALIVADLAYAQAVSVGPQAAAAATTPEEDLIIVTGSRIRRDPLAQDTPVVTIDQTELARTGLSSVADILQRLPSAGGGLNSKVNASGNFGNPPDGGGVGAGSAEIDLRYLSAKRTLVLVDGLRFVNGSSASGIPASVDINTLPANMIERIEVLQSGASPLYGSDAIAGVVNIITKQAQEGLQASAQVGSFRAGDGETQNYNASFGWKADTTNLVVGVTYVKQEAVRAADRSIAAFPEPGATSCLAGGCSGATPLGRFLIQDYGNPANAAGLDLTLKAAVTGRPRYDLVNPTGPNSDFKAFGTADRFNFAPFNYFLTPSERYGGFISFKQELSDDVNLRVKALYNRRNSQNQAAFIPLFVGPDAGNGNLLDTISIDATNPYNPFGRTLSAGGAGRPPANYSFVARRLVEAGRRTYTQHVETISATATLDGSFGVGSRRWYWDVNATLGSNDAKQSFTGNVNSARLAQALGPISACTGSCVPFNIFGGVGSVSADQLAFVTFTERNRSSQRLGDFTANLSGDLFDLPAGPVGFAVGFEHRDQKGSFDPDPITAAGLGSDIPAQPARGRFNADEIFAEVRVPLLADTAFFQSLELNGAVRHSDYSTFGGNTTFTGGATWKPVNDLLLRGSYAESFRAPSIGELFGSLSRFDSPIADPCTDINGTAFGTPAPAAVRANCIADGVPASGSYQEPTTQVSIVTGGNRALQPETARTLLFGGVYSPGWARENAFASLFNIEANYYDIKLDGAISSISANVLLDRCAQAGDALSCAATSRSSNGFISQVSGVLQNIGGIRTKGIDITLNYRSPNLSGSTIGLSINSALLLKYNEAFPATTGFTVVKRRGTERGSPDQAFPKFKSTGVVDWTIGGLTASLTGRYIDSVTESQNGNRLASRLYGDVQVSFEPEWFQNRVTLTVGVNNVFDKDPPACVSCSLNNFDPTTYDIPGQFGYLRLSYKM